MSLSKDISEDDLERRAYVLLERKRIIERVLNAGWRGGATGFAIRGGLNLVTAILGAAFKRRKGVLAGRSSADAFYDTMRYVCTQTIAHHTQHLRYAVFFSSLASTYVLLEEGIAARFGKQRYDWRGRMHPQYTSCAGAVTGARWLLGLWQDPPSC